MEELSMSKLINRSKVYLLKKCVSAKAVLNNNKGEGYIDTAVKILIAVVLGALLLAGLYSLFGEVVMPTLTQRIRDMFNYGGTI
jgi:hypothetical protein